VVGAPGPWPPGPSKSGPAISTLFCSFVFLYNFHIAVKNVLLFNWFPVYIRQTRRLTTCKYYCVEACYAVILLSRMHSDCACFVIWTCTSMLISMQFS